MTQLTWGRTGLLSGGNDSFLSGVRDIAISGTFGAPLVWTSGRPGLAGFTVAADGALTRFDLAGFPQPTRVGLSIDLQEITLGTRSFLAVTGVNDAGLWAYEINGNGGIPGRGISLGSVPMPPDLMATHTLVMNGATHVFGARRGLDRIEGWRIAEDGLLGGQRSFAIDTPVRTEGIIAFDSIGLGGQTLLLAITDGRDALLSYRLAADGRPEPADQVAVADGLGIAGPSALQLVNLQGQAYAIVAASGSSTLSVFGVAADGTLTAVDHVIDSLDTRFARVSHLQVVEMGGAVYVAAAGADNGLSLFQLLPGGYLLHLLTREDTAALGLSDISALAMRAAGNLLQIAVGSETEQGLTWLTAQTGPTGVTRSGDATDATLAGSAGNDLLLGGAGDERLAGGAGNDILRDGAGRDTLSGGEGADVFLLDADGVPDRIEGFQVNLDRIDLSHWAFFRNAGQLTIREIEGGLRISFGTEVLDILTEGAAALTAAMLAARDLTDLDRVLPGWFEEVSNEPGGGGQTGGNGPDTLTGGAADDSISGGGGADQISGDDGNDTLDGGTGADTLTGGPGSDVFVVDNPLDVINERWIWAGTDHVLSSVDFWMRRAHVENLTLTGDGDTRGVGNGLANVITGNAGDNVLDGGKNNDTLIGGQGDDTYYLRAPGDTAVELAGGGTDVIRAYRSVQMPAHVEWLYLQTDVALNVNGNDEANLIVGNNAANVLAGREGRDTLKGQGGADTFVFDRAAGADNVDRIVDFTPGEDRIAFKATLFGLGRGAVDEPVFRLGKVARDADDHILYDPATGGLWVDSDGNGPGRAVLTFVLDGHPDLRPEDIFLF